MLIEVGEIETSLRCNVISTYQVTNPHYLDISFLFPNHEETNLFIPFLATVMRFSGPAIVRRISDNADEIVS